jgi:hypothetical protein
MWISVNCCTFGSQTPLLEPAVESGQLGRSFSQIGISIDHRTEFGIQGNEDATAAVQKRSVKDQVPVAIKATLGDRWMLKPVRNDPPNVVRAVAALERQLTYRVSFGDPSFEPDAFVMNLVRSVRPAKRPATTPTEPSLLSMTTRTVTDGLRGLTLWAVLFLVIVLTIIEQVQ